MYIIKADDTVIFYSLNPEKSITSAKVTLEVNSTNNLEIVLPQSSKYYNSITMLKSVISVYDDGERIFYGRAVSEDVDWYNNKTIKCEGFLGFLYDSVQRPYNFRTEYTGTGEDSAFIKFILNRLLTVHNEQVEDYKKLYLGDVTVTDKTENKEYSEVIDPDDSASLYQTNETGTATELKTSYETTFNAINSLLINNLAGYLYVREGDDGKMYLDYLKNYLPSEGQIISFGVNLLDYSASLDYSGICTGVLPLGKTTEDGSSKKMYQSDSDTYLTIADVNNGSDIYWDEQMVNWFGKIVKVVKWSSVTDASKLLSKAKKYITKTQYKNLNLECKVIDLKFIDKTSKPLHFLHMVRVVSFPHNLDRKMPITKMEKDLLNPANDTITLGKTYKSASETVKDSASTLQFIQNGLADAVQLIDANAGIYNLT